MKDNSQDRYGRTLGRAFFGRVDVNGFEKKRQRENESEWALCATFM